MTWCGSKINWKRILRKKNSENINTKFDIILDYLKCP